MIARRAVLGLTSSLMFVPLLYMLGMGFKTPHDVFASPLNPFSATFTLDNYAEAISRLNYLHMLGVSIVYALGVTIGQLALAIPAAYALAFRDFPGRDLLFVSFIATLPVPFVVTYIPNYLLLAQLGLLNTFAGLIVPQLASAYGIFLLRQHFRRFPRSVIEAAHMDGASSFTILRRIVVPSSRPTIAALGVFIFVSTWNQYIWPLLVAPNTALMTLTVGVQNFANGEGGNRWGPLMAAATLATLPTLVVYLAVRRQMLQTLSEGAVKG